MGENGQELVARGAFCGAKALLTEGRVCVVWRLLVVLVRCREAVESGEWGVLV
jgi:hypothetical protein